MGCLGESFLLLVTFLAFRHLAQSLRYMSFVYTILHLPRKYGNPPVLHERTGTVVKQLVWFRVVRCPGVVMPLLCVCGSLGARTHTNQSNDDARRAKGRLSIRRRLSSDGRMRL